MKGEEHFTIKYFPDNETLEAECQCGDSLKKSTICSIDVRDTQNEANQSKFLGMENKEL